jgi:hypothetical protein
MEKRVGWNEVVTLTFGDIVDETLRCQKYLLIDKSDYFKAMFSSGMVETKSNTVERQVCSSCSSSGTCHVIVQQNFKNIK